MAEAERLEAARRFYAPMVRRGSDGEFAEMFVDEYGPGIPHKHWEAMKSAGWWEYVGGSYILGDYEIWKLTELGKTELSK